MYKATLTSDLPNYPQKTYYGICETNFKLRYANHLKSFNIEKYKKETQLSNELCKMEEAGASPSVRWEILQKVNSYNSNTKRCNLCLNEKLEIVLNDDNNILNIRNEVISKCRHQKYALVRYDTKD